MLTLVLDLGTQTVFVLMIDTAKQAISVVHARQYAPEGRRAVGAALARTSDFRRRSAGLSNAKDQICILAQIESVKAFEILDEIVAVVGIDEIFIGPAELAASCGWKSA